MGNYYPGDYSEFLPPAAAPSLVAASGLLILAAPALGALPLAAAPSLVAADIAAAGGNVRSNKIF